MSVGAVDRPRSDLEFCGGLGVALAVVANWRRRGFAFLQCRALSIPRLIGERDGGDLDGTINFLTLDAKLTGGGSDA
jgi:hypothetical protein